MNGESDVKAPYGRDVSLAVLTRYDEMLCHKFRFIARRYERFAATH